MSARPSTAIAPVKVLAIRRGPGANCSSIGSVVDMLFGAAVVGGALYAAIVASLSDRELVQIAPKIDASPELDSDAARDRAKERP